MNNHANTNTKNNKKYITDEHGTVYELDRKLGEGGQGKVYSVKNGRYAIKVLQQANQSQREELRRQIKLVRQLDLTGLNIARPIALLKEPRLGYVMELLTGMEPLSNLIPTPLQFKEIDNLVEWYLQGGGLGRRLRLLAKCAEIFSKLHAKGLVYGDPSPNNIFISSSNNSDEVWLIDSDNLRSEDAAIASRLRTTPYAAPEIELGISGTNTLTDAHAFAVIAFKTLSFVHPLMGDLVENGDPRMIDQSVQGKLPWIDAPDDDRNRSSYGFPRDMVLSPRLQRLCAKTFCEGLTNSRARPSVNQWVETLHSAADYILHCQHCESTFYATSKQCPWCGAPRSAFVQLAISQWEPEYGAMPPILQAIALQINQPIELTRRITRGWVENQQDQACIKLEAKQEPTGIHITVQSVDGRSYWLTSDGREKLEVEIGDRPKRFPIDQQRFGSWFLHFGALDRPHRVAKFNLVMGGVS
jgi:DNA-binding helix-hairpin-helix protein with protein kinase domain